MKHFTVPSFWDSYEKLPLNIKSLADKNFELLKKESHHTEYDKILKNP